MTPTKKPASHPTNAEILRVLELTREEVAKLREQQAELSRRLGDGRGA